MTPIAWAGAASIALNLVLGGLWLHARDEATATTVQRDTARADATACSDATEDLREQADKRAAAAKPVRAVAREQAAVRESRADAILSTPAAVPGDDYASARARVDGWLKGRAP
ncbi:hypothetical protein BH10PSE18_BH10PSE18_50320 [soil metagenome]